MTALRRTLLTTLLLLPLSAPAERAYIIDRVEAGLHEDNSTASPIIELLPTGTEVEILARADDQRVQVRTADDQVGWLDARYLMEDEPTRAKLEATRAALEASRAELARLRQLEPQAADDTSATLADLRASHDRLETELGRKRAEVAELRKQLRQQQQSRRDPGAAAGHAPVWLTPRYLLAAAAVLLLIGMLVGGWLMDYRQRRRHGGFRI
ncbi:SH3 domain protein [Methylohalomonas lacus]|uniref:SH3 domain protein n=1 Tax=Methylohalomonas lacus TaxID=398773 RepID=A0AAE3HGS6_9GAMM|nr:TIGR04211 family SH3 domain-containing protein [Methylohalomonas lacus]MCS3902059.1 SH3 domain protein [Methylohalomonas lacus]